MRPSVKILKESCEKLGYNFLHIDNATDSLYQIDNGDKIFYANNINTGIYPINNCFSSKIISDKVFTYQILKKNDFTIPEGNHFFIENTHNIKIKQDNSVINIYDYAEKIGYPVFVKPCIGSGGKGAEVVYNQDELKKQLDEIKKLSYICIIQKFIEQPEYRIFVVNGEVQFSYMRKPLSIQGDGLSTVNEILDKNNYSKYKNSIFFKNELLKNNINIDSILPNGVKLVLQSKTNISAGGEICNIETIHSDELKNWVLKMTSLFQIGVYGIDIFSPNGLDNPQNFTVIELNSSPSLDGIFQLGEKDLVYGIWKKIFSSYFGSNIHNN